MQVSQVSQFSNYTVGQDTLNAQAAQLRARLMNGDAPLDYWSWTDTVSSSRAPFEMVDVRLIAPRLQFLDAPRWSAPQQRFRVRLELATRLNHASHLLPSGYSLGFWEGYRPLSVQRVLWETGMILLRETHPQLREVELEDYLDTFIARPDSAAPHTQGRAVDVALLNAAGEILDAPHELRLLSGALAEAGLSNYEPEWWHWSYDAPGLEYLQ